MAYKITDKCISCGACAANCPVECISQGDEKYIIDKDACIGCGTCARCLPSWCTRRKQRLTYDKMFLNTVIQR